MKYLSIITISVTSLFLSSFTGCEPNAIDPQPDLLSTTEEENLGLVYMREEEKLARDIYLTLFEMYNNRIFNNISKAEQQHMDQLLTLLDKYEIADPSLEDIGVFSNDVLQQLYNDLIQQGSDSEVAALLVGATIEDLDISDLDDFKAETSDPDIIQVYESLTCGSRNHMRAFVRQLDILGVDYTPQFISQEDFDQIIAGEQEKCGQSN